MAATLRPRLRSAVWCAMLRMLDVVADFLSRGQWRDDLIDKWREAFRLLEATDKHLVSEYHLGMNTRWALGVCMLDSVSLVQVILTLSMGLS